MHFCSEPHFGALFSENTTCAYSISAPTHLRVFPGHCHSNNVAWQGRGVFRQHARLRGLLEIIAIAKQLPFAKRPAEERNRHRQARPRHASRDDQIGETALIGEVRRTVRSRWKAIGLDVLSRTRRRWIDDRI